MTFSHSHTLSIAQNRSCARSHKVYFLTLLLCAVFLAGASPVLAEASPAMTEAAGESTADTVTAYIKAEWQALGGDPEDTVSFPALGKGLSLPACQTTPEVGFVRHLQPGRNGAEVRCSQPFWQQFIAFELHVYGPVLVLKEALPADTQLTTEHFQTVILDTSGLSQGYYSDPATLLGMQSRRPLRAGTPISPDMLRPVNLIERGQAVKVRLNKPGIRIVMEGTALSDGHAGERIRVRNLSSGKILYAEVINSSVVEIH